MNPADFLPVDLASPELQAFAAGFPVALLHTGATLLLLILGATIYLMLSPYKEISHIREGNSAAAVAFGGALVAISIPLAVALTSSTTAKEILVWGFATLAVQLLIYRLTDLMLAGLQQRIHEGEVSASVLLVSAKLAVAIIIASAVST